MNNSKFLRSKNLMYGCKKGLREETEKQQRRRIATSTRSACNDDTSVFEDSCLAELVEASRSSKWTLVSCEESRRDAAFTLVELVIVIAIVIVLSVVSVPIYRSYVDKAKMSEGYALLGTVLSAQKAYYSEYGNFLIDADAAWHWTNYNTVLGIDARGNKYFTNFCIDFGYNPTTYFCALAKRPIIDIGGKSYLILKYNVSTGGVFSEGNWNGID